jgi:hypothetical protein
MDRTLNRTLFLLILLFVSLQSIQAAPLKVNTYAEPTTIGRDEQLTYTIEISGGKGFKAQAPKLPDLQDFSLINMMTSSATNYSIINGKVDESVTKSLVYRLLPKRTGNLKIPAFSFEAGGQMYSTQTVNIRVLDLPRAGSSGQGQANPWGGGQSNPLYMMDPFDINPGFEPIGEIDIVAIPEKTTVYVGEPFLVTYRLYANKPVSSLEIKEEKDFGGYGKEIYSEPNRLNFETASYKNQRYRTAVIKISAISPNRTGTIQVPQVTANVQLGAMGLFTETVQSKMQSVTVRDLPAGGRPDNFTGAVGSFRVSDNLGKSQIRVGEAIEYKLTISGRGNFNQFSNPEYASLQDFRIATPIAENRIQAGISGTRTITYLLIPRREGSFTLPGISFNWFDPASGTYRSFQGQPRRVTVKPGNVLTYLSNVFQRESTLTLTPLQPRLNYRSQQVLIQSAWFWIPAILILLSLLPSWWFARHSKLKQTDPELAAQRSSDRVLKKYLRQAETAALEQSQEFYPRAEQGLMRYLSDKYHIPHRYSNREKIYQLRLKGLDNDLVTRLEAFLQRCQEARYMPGGFNSAGLNDDLATLKSVIASFIRQPGSLKPRRWW